MASRADGQGPWTFLIGWALVVHERLLLSIHLRLPGGKHQRDDDNTWLNVAIISSYCISQGLLSASLDVVDKASNVIVTLLENSTHTVPSNYPSKRFIVLLWALNTLRPRQNGRHFADDILKCIFLNENVWIPIKFPLKFVPKGPIDNIPTLVQVMAWRRPGDKP